MILDPYTNSTTGRVVLTVFHVPSISRSGHLKAIARFWMPTRRASKRIRLWRGAMRRGNRGGVVSFLLAHPFPRRL